MSALTKYEAARAALAECRSVDEVKSILDKAEAARSYARMARDREMEINAAEIRIRAERRLGQMLRSARDDGLLAKGGRPRKGRERAENKIYLRDIGVDNKLSMRAQHSAASSDDIFERTLESWRGRILSDRKRRVTVGLSEPPKLRKGAIDHGGDIFDNTTLASGQKIGTVRVGSLRRLGEAALAEWRLLTALAEHLGPADHGLTVRESVSANTLKQILERSEAASQ